MSDNEPHPKVEAVVYSVDGAKIRFGDEITDEERDTIEDAFDNGERDPGKLRELVDSEQ